MFFFRVEPPLFVAVLRLTVAMHTQSLVAGQRDRGAAKAPRGIASKPSLPQLGLGRRSLPAAGSTCSEGAVGETKRSLPGPPLQVQHTSEQRLGMPGGAGPRDDEAAGGRGRGGMSRFACLGARDLEIRPVDVRRTKSSGVSWKSHSRAQLVRRDPTITWRLRALRCFRGWDPTEGRRE